MYKREQEREREGERYRDRKCLCIHTYLHLCVHLDTGTYKSKGWIQVKKKKIDLWS